MIHPSTQVTVEGRARHHGMIERMREAASKPEPRAILGSLVLVAAFVVADRCLVAATRMAAERYESPVILLEWLPTLLVLRPVSIAMLLALVAGLIFTITRRTLGPTWSDIESGKSIRAVVVVLAAILTWEFANYPFNFYYGQAHAIDRILLVVLCGLVIRRPIFVIPFLVQLLLIMHQFFEPIGGYAWTVAILPARILILFACTLVLSAVTKRRWIRAFAFVACCIVASYYWSPGIGKIPMDWIARDHIYYLLPSTYANGWLGFLEPETIGRITAGLAPLNPLLKAGTLVAELGSVLFLWNRTTRWVLPVVWIGFHVGVFLLSGIFFWMWMVLDAVLLYAISRESHTGLFAFSRAHFALSLVLIAAGSYLFDTVRLSWVDSRATYTYRFEARDEAGRVMRLPPRSFAPYDYQFTLSGFHYLHAHRHLRVLWGATNGVTADALENATQPEDVLAVEEMLGVATMDSARAAAFDRLMRRYADHAPRMHRPRWKSLVFPPKLWTFPLAASPPSSPLTEVTVYQVLSYFDGRAYREIRTRPVRRIDLTTE